MAIFFTNIKWFLISLEQQQKVLHFSTEEYSTLSIAGKAKAEYAL